MTAMYLKLMGTGAIWRQLSVSPGLKRLNSLLGSRADTSAETVTAILEEAEKFSRSVLDPIDTVLDRKECQLLDGRVHTCDEHKTAWRAYVEAGWLTLGQAEQHGGQNLPLIVQAACEELFERGCVAFGMLPTLQRAASEMLSAHAPSDVQQEWLPKLSTGEWGATICISEPGAGSDVGRIRTHAVEGDGKWRIHGEKMWISFGDQDLTEQIGHIVLCRTPGTLNDLSVFLVPSMIKDRQGQSVRNAVTVTRLEQKLGLHGSPTCALTFAGAEGQLLGNAGRGLGQLFSMIVRMRLSVAIQGLGVAGKALELAARYADERRQGGPPQGPPTPIAQHLDIQRLLMSMAGRVVALRGLVMALAAALDLSGKEDQDESRADAKALAQWLLPIAKNLAADTAFEVASEALQIFGGAGYLRDFPVEQLLRDSRVFSVYEGTSGMQALDLLRRRLLQDAGRGLQVFLREARAQAEQLPERWEKILRDATDQLHSSAQFLRNAAGPQREAGANHFLSLAGAVATGWAVAPLIRETSEDTGKALRATAEYWLQGLSSRVAHLSAQVVDSVESAPLFERMFTA